MLKKEKCKDIIKQVSKITKNKYKLNILGRLSEDTIYSIVEDLIEEINYRNKTIRDLEEQRDNDYDPDLEIPLIHGKGISW